MRNFLDSVRSKNGFTLIELLIVITIIAILAATIIPNFIGFDTEARVTASKTNLETLRTRVTLFRAKEGKYPASLKDLVDTYYLDMGVKKPYLQKMPVEMITTKSGNMNFADMLSTEQPITRDGGWVYYTDTAEVYINSDQPLDKKWGEYSGQKPIEW